MSDPTDPKSYHQSDIQACISSIDELLKAGIFSPQGLRSPFLRPSITQILIDLNDVLQKASSMGKRISFIDDVFPNDGSQDVTTLINNCRNACCHISSGKHLFENNKFTFMVMIGKHENGVVINGQSLGCQYEDDVAIFWGNIRLYLKRNLLRAFQEAQAIFPEPWSRF